ncbi:MAG TPA: M23 family metallopeptidase [Pyrinomonadaceae bacterium]|nr:M23 family metallopeptidase [Pyrinomonadaceae bacterium]
MSTTADASRRVIALTAQPAIFPTHLTFVVKKLIVAVLLVSAFLTLGSITGVTSEAGRVAEKLLNKVIVYGHMARLFTREPDRELSMPVQDVSKAQVVNTWGAPRGVDRLHRGQDIFAPRGTPVLSATEGYILRIGQNSLGGQTVSVVGAGGRVYYYAHLDSYATGISEGDYVTDKSVLGYVGTTGNAAGTPPHLHFGVYAAGGPLNPLPLLVDRPKDRPAQTEAAQSKRQRDRKRSEAD